MKFKWFGLVSVVTVVMAFAVYGAYAGNCGGGDSSKVADSAQVAGQKQGEGCGHAHGKEANKDGCTQGGAKKDCCGSPGCKKDGCKKGDGKKDGCGPGDEKKSGCGHGNKGAAKNDDVKTTGSESPAGQPVTR